MEYIINDNTDKSLIYYERNVYSVEEQKELFGRLDAMDDFKEGDVNGVSVSRLQKWHQKDGKYFSPEWKNRYERWVSDDYDKYLLDIEKKMQEKINKICDKYDFIEKPVFNSCLLNKYRDGNDIIKMHTDNQNVFGETPTIVILSLGETRTLKFTRKIYNPDNIRTMKIDDTKKDLNIDIEMESGSILIMGGMSQRYWFHSIEPEENKKKRYSITLREYKNNI